jgi:hypothetical protein
MAWDIVEIKLPRGIFYLTYAAQFTLRLAETLASSLGGKMLYKAGEFQQIYDAEK